MTCPKCKTEMVKARATNFGEDYNYCRVCKKEEKELITDKLEDYETESWERVQGVGYSYYIKKG